MPVRTVNQKFNHPQWGKIFKGLWYRPTKIADLRFSFWQIHHASNIRFSEDKIQNWGMYLFTISCGSCALDQRSGDGWFSGWSKIFVLCKRNSNVKFWSTRCEDRFSTEQNHPYYPIQKKGQSGGTESPKRGPFPSWKTDRLPDLRVLPGQWSQWFRRELCRPIYKCSSKWWYSGIRFEMARKFDINDENPIWWHLGRILHFSEYESLRSSRPYWNCTMWRFIRRKLDLIITDWRQWWKGVSNKIYEIKNLAPEMEIMKETPWSRIRGRNSVNKEFWEIVGNGSPTGSVLEETTAVSVTISISVQKWHSRILLRALLRRQSVKNASRTRSPRGRSPSGKMARLPCKDYLKRNLHQFILWKMASSRMLVLQVGEWMHIFLHVGKWNQIWVKVLLSASPGWWQASQKVSKEWWQKCSGYVENYTTIGLRISRYGAAEVFIDFTEELRHTQNDPMCSIHKSRRTSC